MENQINILNMELENYDGDIKDLNEELNSLKNSHAILKKEFSSVIEENKKLSDTLKKLLNTECSLKVKVNEDYENIIANLKGRIDELLTEKNTVMKLWQNSAKTIEILEDKARMISLGQDDYMTKPEIEKIKQSYEEKLQQMQQNLISTKEKFHESMKYSAEKRDAQKESDIERSLENQATAFKIVKNLESEILTLQTRLEYTFEQKLMLEKSLMCKDGIVEGKSYL
ncbi:uncharacterized protein LOC115881256 [Sitophilus oryzae]|uniref:Uncharacterized protein LOC115881256 n=1 Tax=Sitophilus oryzae TaxID=7048 RepID=A0A6J2XSP6_SITOR|nr:uncharacterized protein LOC115881256 [Sitophilus oryzae]